MPSSGNFHETLLTDLFIFMDTSEQVQPSRFLSIPPELRTEIYSYLFASPSWTQHRDDCGVKWQCYRCPTPCGPCSTLNSLEDPPIHPPIQVLLSDAGVEYRQLRTKRDSCHYHDIHVWDGFPSNYASILRTCRQVYVEAADVLYSDTLFLLDVRIPGEHAHRRRTLEKLNRPLGLEQATLLRRVKHLDLTIRLRRSNDFVVVGDILTRLSSILSTSLKSAATFISFRNIYWGTDANDVKLEQWQHLLASIRKLNLKGEVVPLSVPRWLKPGNERFRELEQATRGRMKMQEWIRGNRPW